jgi:N-acetyl-S-(2-succino)cysteine monooxygenase
LKGRMAKYGRDPDGLKILAGMPVVVGRSQAEAEAQYLRLQQLLHPDVGVFRLGMDLEVDLRDLPLDQPIPEDRLPKAANFHKAFFDGIMATIRAKNPTLRELYLGYERGRKTIKGTPAQVADTMEHWFRSGACDGFMMQFHTLPQSLEAFVDGVIPELQRRGLFRHAYQGATLRDHLGLARPTNPHTKR